MDAAAQTGGFRMAADSPGDRLDWGMSREVCGPDATGARQLTILDVTFEPGKGHAFHQHPEQEEVLYVVSGRIEQWVDREMRVLGPGDSAFVPAGVVHATFTVDDAPARILAIFGPCVGERGFTTIEMAETAPWSDLRT